MGKQLKKPQGAATLPGVGTYPFETVVVDVLDMSQEPTESGYKKLLIWMDHLSSILQYFWMSSSQPRPKRLSVWRVQ